MDLLYPLFFTLEVALLFVMSRQVYFGFGKIFYRMTKNEKWTGYLIAILFLPGTMVHEFAHFLTALFLLVPVGEIDLIPEFDRREEKLGIKLGSVPIGKTDPFRRFIIGIAPLIFGTILIFLALYYITVTDLTIVWWHYVLLGYLVFEIGNTMFLSKRDLEGAWKVLLVLVIVSFSSYILGYHPVLSKEVIDITEKAIIFLGMPIIIDMVLLALVKLA